MAERLANVEACRSCGAAIIWAKGFNGKANPLDAEPSPKGNIRLAEDGTAIYLNKVAAEEARMEKEELFLSHFATCPNSKAHRKK